MNVKLISTTKSLVDGLEMTAEQLIGYIARVSNPSNQLNLDTIPKLLSYCIKNKHWSVFEHAHMTLEITTSRAIAAQILRHRSFTFQEFSQRYAEATEFETYQARRQDTKNRQNSIDDMGIGKKDWFIQSQKDIQSLAKTKYQQAIGMGLAKELARMLLPLSTQTTLYMTGNVRSWAHYLELRTSKETQLEHREIAQACKDIFVEQFPVISEALEWRKSER